MIPLAKLNVSPVTSSQPPHATNAARRPSTRGARRSATSPAARSTSDAGSSHAI